MDNRLVPANSYPRQGPCRGAPRARSATDPEIPAVIPENVRQSDWWRWPGTTMLIVTEYSKYLFAQARDWAEELLAPRAAASAA